MITLKILSYNIKIMKQYNSVNLYNTGTKTRHQLEQFLAAFALPIV